MCVLYAKSNVVYQSERLMFSTLNCPNDEFVSLLCFMVDRRSTVANLKEAASLHASFVVIE